MVLSRYFDNNSSDHVSQIESVTSRERMAASSSLVWERPVVTHRPFSIDACPSGASVSRDGSLGVMLV